ncbi:MAG: hypothetical protein WKF71_11585 [Pyrinomonadaceae bacterium]
MREACAWKLAGAMPEYVKQIVVEPIAPPLDCDFVFSSLPSNVARETEEAFARAGFPVISNSSAYRMDADVPLLIPEINFDHLGLIEIQKRKRGFDKGFIITNPNCAIMSFAPPLAALDRNFGVESVFVTTLQAISGAGYPGVSVVRHHRKRDAVYRGRRAESRNRSAENFGQISTAKRLKKPILPLARNVFASTSSTDTRHRFA